MKTITVDAVLFDMDGTLIDSTPGVVKAWATFARDYDLHAEQVTQAAHGRRLVDTLREFCGITDENKLQEEVDRFESEVLRGGPVVLPGAIELLTKIQDGSIAAQKHGWTIVTSATNVYAPQALEYCKVPLPPAGLVASNDVTRGKPQPDPYLAGAKKLGVDPTKCLVVEDAPSGIRAGHAAGAKVLAVCTSHSRHEILESGSEPDFIVEDLTRVKAQWDDGQLILNVDEIDPTEL